MNKRKLNTLVAAMLLGFGISGVAQAVVLQAGDFGMKLTGFAYYDDPNLSPDINGPFPPNPNPQAAPPGWTGSGATWAIAEITSIHPLTAGTNPDQPGLGSAYWNASAADRLFVRLGGTQASYLCNIAACASALPAGNAAAAVIAGGVHDVYFITDPNVSNTKGGVAYAEIYHHTSGFNAYTADISAGPGTGAYNSFGNFIAYGADGLPGGGDDPTLWLDLAMVPGILANPSYLDFNASLGPDLTSGTGDDLTVVEKVTVSSLTTGASTLYTDVVGGSAASAFGTNIFPVLDPAWPIRADVRAQTNLIAQYNPVSNKWNANNGWTTTIQDPITGGLIPEPATLALLGLGLIGLAGLRRKAA